MSVIFFTSVHVIYYIIMDLLYCEESHNVNLAEQDFEVMPGSLEMLLLISRTVKIGNRVFVPFLCVCVHAAPVILCHGESRSSQSVSLLFLITHFDKLYLMMECVPNKLKNVGFFLFFMRGWGLI